MNVFDIKAKRHEKAFFKQCMKNHGVFHTGTGKQNQIITISSTFVQIRSKIGKNSIRISRKHIRAACSYLLSVRTITRKSLEKFHQFSSALMGLLRSIFFSIARFSRTTAGLLRLTLKGTRWYCAGTDRSPGDMALAKTYGSDYLLLSYWAIRDDVSGSWRKNIKRLGFDKILLDSGAFSAHAAQTRGWISKGLDVEEYAEFVIKHQEVIAHFFSLDVVQDSQQTKMNYEYLIQRGLNPIPVWQCNSGFEELERILQANDHDFVGVGGSCFLTQDRRNQLFKDLFNRFPNQNFHGLGVSDQSLFNYPWFSADGTAWLNPRKWGTVITHAGYEKLPTDWHWEEGVGYSLELLNQLECNYTGQISCSLFLPPRLKRPVQLSLF